ncbi:LacI family DNA-binding transcriptional regulator [Vibrio sp. dhg]|uniref:LacI family DNA-binding transcriptional regulator n=1 Tax=Vibrio sp. dhg TaxID=2163016 RepID=UPI000E4EA045|nr:LacI family DNA-binding transcriptional regulator [Vibrio sp. dhg]AXT73765.1 LacI family transcriptional regulator [Vibrio sp. dhg]
MITKNATIKDVAQKANVTNITVSRAFSSPDKVKKETRELIYKIADEMNYIPNVYAKNLKTKTSNIIGFVTDNAFNPVYSSVINEVCSVAERKGYSVMIFSSSGSSAIEEKAIKTLVSYKAAGIFLSVVNDDSGYNPPYLSMVNSSDTELVLMDRDIKSMELPGVFIDNHDSGEKVGNILSSMKCKRVLVIGGDESSMITRERIEGIQSTISNDVSLDYLFSDYEYEKSKPIIINYLADHKGEYDCIAGLNGIITLASIRATNKLNWHGVKFVSVDNVPNADDFGIEIPCVVHDNLRWGRELAELLFSKIDGSHLMERVYLKGVTLNTKKL